ncbi:MAG TPA: hypothetical protein VF178_05170 [Gemmatimonadaceae bacterium]
MARFPPRIAVSLTRVAVPLCVRTERRAGGVELLFENGPLLVGRRPFYGEVDVQLARLALGAPVRLALRAQHGRAGAVLALLTTANDGPLPGYPLGALRREAGERLFPHDLDAECADMLASVTGEGVWSEDATAVDAFLANL